MEFWETVWTGVISGVVAAGVLGVFAWVRKSTRPEPAFVLLREGGTWMLHRTQDAVAINVQWSLKNQLGDLVHSGQPQGNPPDMKKGVPEFILNPLLPDDQLVVFWGAQDRTNSHSVTIMAGVVEYEVWDIGKRPGGRSWR